MFYTSSHAHAYHNISIALGNTCISVPVRCRLLLTSLVVFSFAVLWRYQEHENVLRVSHHIHERFMNFRDKLVSMATPFRDLFDQKYRSEPNS